MEAQADDVDRIRLNRSRVLRAAVQLADEQGFESLTMRKLARRLDVEAMSLYNHVANKDDLLNGVVDLVVQEIDLPANGEDWRPAMRRRATSAREVLGRHPWAAGLIESSADPSPVRLRYAEAVVACLRDGGFSSADAIHAFSLLDSYIYGFALQEKNMPFTSAEDLAVIGDSMLRGLRTEEFPNLTAIVTDVVMKRNYDFRDEFEVGLDLILDTLERLRARPTRE